MTEIETPGRPAAVYATHTLSVVSSHAAPRLSTGVCTMTELTGVANAADPQAALTAVLGSNEPCGKCILACLSSGADDPTPCLLDCTGTSTAGGTTTAPATITTSSALGRPAAVYATLTLSVVPSGTLHLGCPQVYAR
jgi:hypothetical protein